MKVLKPFFILLVLAAAMSCSNSQIPVDEIDPPVDLPDFEVVWKTEMPWSPTQPFECALADDGMIVSFRNHPNARLQKLDRLSGQVIADYYPNGENLRWPVSFKVYDNIAYCNTNQGMYAINLENGEEVWNHLSPNSSHQGWQILGKKIYIDETFPRKTFSDYSFLMEYDLYTGAKRELLRVTKEELGVTPELGGFNLWIHPDTQDSILLFTVSGIRKNTDIDINKSIRAYNLSQDQYLWIGERFGTTASSTSRQIIVDGDHMYHSSDNSVYKFDCKTGEMLWNFEMDLYVNKPRINFTDLYVDETGVYANSDVQVFHKLNKETGSVIWRKEIASNCSEKMEVYGNHLFMGCHGQGKIFGVNMETGEIDYELDKVFPHAVIKGKEIWYDEETGYFYSMDSGGAFCLKLRE